MFTTTVKLRNSSSLLLNQTSTWKHPKMTPRYAAMISGLIEVISTRGRCRDGSTQSEVAPNVTVL
jgi:hypothetical protein